jgi:hypothetical protein
MSGKVTAVEFGDFDLIEKMENADHTMAANVKSKTHFKKKAMFAFLSYS